MRVCLPLLRANQTESSNWSISSVKVQYSNFDAEGGLPDQPRPPRYWTGVSVSFPSFRMPGPRPCLIELESRFPSFSYLNADEKRGYDWLEAHKRIAFQSLFDYEFLNLQLLSPNSRLPYRMLESDWGILLRAWLKLKTMVISSQNHSAQFKSLTGRWEHHRRSLLEL